MFSDILFVVNHDELNIHDYFTRELLEVVHLGDKLQIECYDEMVFLSGELKKDPMTNKLYLCDHNGFICDIEFGQVYEKVWIFKD